MAARRSTLDPDPAELARRRLRLLGTELAPVAGQRRSADPADPAAAWPGPTPTRADVDGPPLVTRSRRHAGARVSWFTRLTGRALDALPPTLRGRVAVSAHHVTVVALLLAAAMAAATWMLTRAEPQRLAQHASLQLPASAPAGPVTPTPATQVPVTAPQPPGSAPATPAADTDPTEASTGAVVVHVAGRVRHPGVVELPAGSRVVDAIEAAGGARPGAHLGRLNLARPLVDGEQVAVGVRGAVAAPPVPAGATATVVPGATEGATGLVNINTASQAELEELPGVGPVTATSIIEWRTENGGFGTVDELIDVSGIGEVTLGELRDLVTV